MLVKIHIDLKNEKDLAKQVHAILLKYAEKIKTGGDSSINQYLTDTNQNLVGYAQKLLN